MTRQTANTELALILLGGTGGLGTFLTLGLALIGALRGSVLADLSTTTRRLTRGRCCSSQSCSGWLTCSAGTGRLGSHTWFKYQFTRYYISL